MRELGLGLETDLALIATRGEVIDRGPYVVAVTPDDPEYRRGNLLVLRQPPQPGQLAWALDSFARELGTRPEIRHVTLSWRAAGEDVAPATRDELTAAGLTVELDDAMVGAPRPAAAPADIELRALAADELARVAELRFANDGPGGEAHRQFLRRRAAWHRDLVTRGAARFWGAFDAHTLVGSLGVVGLGALARYQNVVTARSHRGRGIASALLAVAGTAARAAGAEQLVIVAEAGSAAAQLYARAGFQAADRTVTAFRRVV